MIEEGMTVPVTATCGAGVGEGHRVEFGELLVALGPVDSSR